MSTFAKVTSSLALAALLFTTNSCWADGCASPSWIFSRGTYSHDPDTGARVAQYDRHAFVEELPDPRLVTSGYRRTRTNLRSADGSVDSYYQVQSWANGRGMLDAEWERFHDAWRQSYLTNSNFQSGPNGWGNGGGNGGGNGWGNGNWNNGNWGNGDWGNGDWGNGNWNRPGPGGGPNGRPSGGGYRPRRESAFGFQPDWYQRGF